MIVEQDATPWWVKSRDWFTQSLPYILVVMFGIFGAFGFVVSQNQVNLNSLEARQEAQERVAFEQCRSDNDTRVLIAQVLDSIAEPQFPDESDVAYRARVSAFEEAKTLLLLNECPEKPADVDMP